MFGYYKYNTKGGKNLEGKRFTQCFVAFPQKTKILFGFSFFNSTQEFQQVQISLSLTRIHILDNWANLVRFVFVENLFSVRKKRYLFC